MVLEEPDPESGRLSVGGTERVAEEAAALTCLSARCPWRPLDWRWRLAQLRASRLLPSHASRKLGRGDVWVARAARHLARLASSSRSARPDVALEGAGCLYVHGGRVRQELEARVLAGQEPTVIAARLGLDPEVVAAYEALHFDVRARLDQRDHVLFVAVGPRLHDGGRGDPEVQLRLHAYLVDPAVVDAWIDALLGPAPGRVVEPRLVETLALARAVAAAPIEEGSVVGWLRLLDRLADLDRMGRDRSAAPVLRPIGRPAVDLMPVPEVMEVDSCAPVDHPVRALEASGEAAPPSGSPVEPPIWLASA